ncbi:DUF488 domain-containing protein [Primorskyibacter flagellatus]|uniref:Uncharacterized conserved protein YeaO, DUF488 family n=1 Tax=Primorskyibacter flagellatus TaxID=1387277 RepID=A0A1W2CD48_9RHOB|nr:DUF488 family protein [Primorskyibacter flagellatus]SMC83100.1 Uncharacterized conserved protein YeaO, DUF488 family [Primorskyibacter flagellatus]
MPARPPVPETPAERIRIKRVYRAARVSDGKRILVDRLWPRGVAQDRARLFNWCKDIAPSDGLRHWFHANPDHWQEFRTRYEAELATRDDLTRELAGYARDDVVTLLYASKDEEHNNAIVLRNYLRGWLRIGGEE